MFHYYLAVLKKYAVFSGRASRAEYWYFFLFDSIIIIGLYSIILIIILREIYSSFTAGSMGVPAWIVPLMIFFAIYVLAVFIPTIAVSVRRMHDVNKSGWFIFIPIYNIILAVTDGTKGDNKYGPEPKVKTN